MSEPSPKLRSKRRQRIQREARHKEQEKSQTDSEADLHLPTHPRVYRNDRYATFTPSSSSTVSNPPTLYTRVAPKRQADNQPTYGDDKLSVRPPVSYTSNEDESSHRRHSPPRGRTKVRLRGILRTPSQSRYRESPNRGRNSTRRDGDSSSTGPRVKFAIRTYSPDEDTHIRRKSISDNRSVNTRRNTISEIRPPEGLLRPGEQFRARRRPRGWDDEQSERAQGFGWQSSRDRFNDSYESTRRQVPSRRDGMDDDEKTIHPRAFGTRRRGESSSENEMQEWRSRARQRSLQPDERLRTDYRVQVHKAPRPNTARYEYRRHDDHDDDGADGHEMGD